MIDFWQGRNTAVCKHPWLTMVRMLLCPQHLGSPVIRSMATWVKGGALSGTVIL